MRKKVLPVLRSTAPVLQAVQCLLGDCERRAFVRSAVLEAPPEVVSEAVSLAQRGAGREDIARTVSKGPWAQHLARAFCVPEARYNDGNTSEEEQACIDRMAMELAAELV